MRTIAATVFVLALGVSFSIVSATGLAGVLGADRAPDGSEVEQNLNESAGQSPAGDDDSLAGGVSQTGDANLIGVIITAGGLISDFAVGVLLLPVTLNRLGLPWYAAAPLGLLAQTITGIGVIEFFTNREWT
jgi:hypothetical protein